MQHEYSMIAKIEIEMTQEMEMDFLPIKPSKLFSNIILILSFQKSILIYRNLINN